MLSLLIIVLIAAIVFFQAIHGLFNALIMALCTLVCTLLAFTYYEPLAKLAGLYETQPAYGEAIMLMALLVVPLFVLRFLVDNYLPGNVVPGVWVDRAGGAAFGLVTALLLVGTLVIAMQMLPFDRAILGWDPYTAELAEGNGLVVDAPAFTHGVVRTLSSGSMGGRPFDDAHDNLRLELWAVRNRDAGARTDSPPDGIKLLGITDVTALPMVEGEETTYATGAPSYPGVGNLESRVFIVRVEAADTCLDTDSKWRLRGTHFRLVTDSGEGFFPVGYLVYAGQWQVLSAPIGDVQITREHTGASRTLTADLLFRVPTAEGKEPSLSHLAFRRSVRLPVREPVVAKELAQMPDDARALGRKKVFGEVRVTGRGMRSVFFPERAVVTASSPIQATYEVDKVDRTGNGTLALPEPSGNMVQAELERHNLKAGILQGPVDKLRELHGTAARYIPLENLHVPLGMRVLRLEGRQLDSTFSGARLLNPRAIVQAQVRFDTGETRPMAGAWVRWKEGNVEQSYLYYSSQPREYEEFLAYPDEKAIRALELYREHLGSVTSIGLLFLVPQDATVVSFSVAAGERFACESPLSVGQPSGRYR
ncbi:MAG: CvpA family protein [Planctomycetes bacterium]|nr:CvpA family protein [Planctomycetota bacterium]